MPTNAAESEPISKTKKPSDSAFKQQRLPAWQPILTAGTVLPFFFVIGILFIPVGIGLLYFSHEVQEISVDYTNCYSTNIKNQKIKCMDVIMKNPKEDCFCQEKFNLKTDFNGPVYMYYGLTNFYQNHRRYVKSRDDNQLLGQLSQTVSSDCEPFAYVEKDGSSIPIAPCGAIANSLFSDSLTLHFDSKNLPVPLLRTGIAWESDKKIKFKNPEPANNLKEAFKGFAKPKNWSVPVYELDLEDNDNNGFKNEDLIVWMRTAALPIFRKLYRRVDHSKDGFKNGLVPGNYTLHIKYSYQVSAFDCTKRMILSTTSLLGGKNPFLGTAYVVVGSLCLILGVILLVIHIKFSKSTNDIINVHPNSPYQ